MERWKTFTPEEDQFLRENWSSLTTDQIAEKLCRTRNSVAGRIHRVGLPAKVDRSASKPKIDRRPRTVSLKKSPPVKLPPDPPPSQYSCTMVDLERTSCRWPLGDPRNPGFRYCGVQEADFPKVPYCTYHRIAQYNPK